LAQRESTDLPPDVQGPPAAEPYLRTQTGFVYMAVVLDLSARRVVGWAVSRSLDAGIAVKALRRCSVRLHCGRHQLEWSTTATVAFTSDHRFVDRGQELDPQLGALLPVPSRRLVQLGASFTGKPNRLAHRVGAACNSARTVSQAVSRMPQLIASEQRERVTGKPPGAARALFRHIAAVLKVQPATPVASGEDAMTDDDDDADDEPG
jgi:hypothetical protein